MKEKSITLTIGSELANVALVGAAVSRLSEFSSLNRDQVNRLELAVVEAVNNAIEHAYGYAPGYDVEVELRMDDNEIMVTIHDTGNSMPSNAVNTIVGEDEAPMPLVEGFNEDLPEGGWGLLLIKSLTDDVSYSSEAGRNSLRITYHCDSEAAL
jgi:serine/threonine-protein kinase RsbW